MCFMMVLYDHFSYFSGFDTFTKFPSITFILKSTKVGTTNHRNYSMEDYHIEITTTN